MIEGARRTLIFLYTDEDVTDLLAVLLQERGYEAASTGGCGTRGLSDEEQLAFAASRGCPKLVRGRARACRDRPLATVQRREDGRVAAADLQPARQGPAEEMRNTVRVLQSYS
jgi:hypothetical protein